MAQHMQLSGILASERQKHCRRIVSRSIKRWISTAVKVELGTGSDILSFRKMSYKEQWNNFQIKH